MRSRLLCILLLVLGCMLFVAAPASASQMIGRNARYASLKVGALAGRQVAAVTYYESGSWHHVLVWGAVNARPYSATTPQVAFKVNYSGGYGSVFGANAWKKLHNTCIASKSLKAAVAMAVAACNMGSNPNEHWALQTWQRGLPNVGVHPRTSLQRSYELHISHWTGVQPVLWLKWGWANASGGIHYDHLYGLMAFHGNRVYGHSSTSVGNPTDSYGRNIYVDTVNPAWAANGAYTQPGNWIRFNGFLTHYPRGDFCASLYKTNLGITRPGYNQGTRYRATAMGPGVTPIVQWMGPPPGNYSDGGFPGGSWDLDPVFPGLNSGRAAYTDAAATVLNDEQRAIAGPVDTCYKVYGPHTY